MNKIKQKRRSSRQRQRLKSHRRSMLAISAVLFLLIGMISLNGMTLRAKDKAYQAQEIELQQQIEEEKARSEEIDDLEKYVGTDEYVEEVARDKLGLVHKNEIIFKAK
ncbi:MAG: septum formation initiator family protein [Lachnospiraceae bacterium]